MFGCSSPPVMIASSTKACTRVGSVTRSGDNTFNATRAPQAAVRAEIDHAAAAAPELRPTA
jgi:hypothetical protein